MPFRFRNTFSPASDTGSGIQALAQALFGGGDTPIEVADAEARRELMRAQAESATENARLFRTKSNLAEDQLRARSPEEIRRRAGYFTGQDAAIVERIARQFAGEPEPGPAAPPALYRRGAAPAQMPAMEIPAQAAGPAAQITEQLFTPEVRGFAPEPITGMAITEPAWTHRDAWDLGEPPGPLVGGVPNVMIGPSQSRPVGPGPMTVPYPMNTPGGQGPAVEVEGTQVEDEIKRRIGAALGALDSVRMGGENVDLSQLADMYIELLRGPMREDVLYGRIDPGEAGARMAATEPGKPLFTGSPQGILGHYSGEYSDTSSPVIGAAAAYDQARARAEDAQAALRGAQIPREQAHADLYRAQAGYYNERDRSSSRTRAGDKPKALTSTQRKALQAAFDAWKQNVIGEVATDADAEVDSEFAMEVMSRAGDLMRDPDTEFFDDPESALAAAIAELAPGGMEDTRELSAWLPGRGSMLAPKGVARKGSTTTQPAATATPPARPAGKSDAQLIQEARDAIAAGADVNQVNARLRAWGVKGQQ